MSDEVLDDFLQVAIEWNGRVLPEVREKLKEAAELVDADATDEGRKWAKDKVAAHMSSIESPSNAASRLSRVAQDKNNERLGKLLEAVELLRDRAKGLASPLNSTITMPSNPDHSKTGEIDEIQ